MQLAAVYRILGAGCHVAVSHIGHFLIIRVDAVIGYIGLSAYGQAVVIDGCITCRNAVQSSQCFRQFHRQRICPVGYHADIVVRQFGRICHTADDIRLFAQLPCELVSRGCRSFYIARISHALIHFRSHRIELAAVNGVGTVCADISGRYVGDLCAANIYRICRIAKSDFCTRYGAVGSGLLIGNRCNSCQIAGYIHRISFNRTVCSGFRTGSNSRIFAINNFDRVCRNIIDDGLSSIGNIIQISIGFVIQFGIHRGLIVVVIIQVGIHRISGHRLSIAGRNRTSSDVVNRRFGRGIQSDSIRNHSVCVFRAAGYGYFAACSGRQSRFCRTDHIISMPVRSNRTGNSSLLGTGNSRFRPGSRLLHITDIGSVGRRISAAGYIRDDCVIGIDTVIGYIGLSAYGQPVIIDDSVTCCNAVHFHVFGQFHRQRICPIGYHADISV